MLGKAPVIAFLATTDPDRTKTFYRRALGLRLIEDNQFALVFKVGSADLRIQKLERFRPQTFTVLGWSVADTHQALSRLIKRGIAPERYPHMEQDELGVWSSPSGAQVAWFRDPDGQLLSLTQFPKPRSRRHRAARRPRRAGRSN